MKLSQAARLNRQGAALLASLKYEDAYEALVEAATILRNIVVADAPPPPSHVYHLTGVTACVSSSMGAEIPSLQESDFYIFSNTILFKVDDRYPDSTVTEDQQRFCGAVIMFNMAAGRHAQARKLGKDCYLEKAFALYSMGMDLLQQVQERSEFLDVLVIAALNNMSHISYELGDIAKSKGLLEAVNPLIASLSEATAEQFRVDECMMNLITAGFVVAARCA